MIKRPTLSIVIPVWPKAKTGTHTRHTVQVARWHRCVYLSPFGVHGSRTAQLRAASGMTTDWSGARHAA